MNASHLAYLMLDWEEKRRELMELEQAIKEVVVELGKSVTTGNVRATFSKGRVTRDYRAAIEASGNNSPVTLQPWRKITYDYKTACEELEIPAEDIPFTQGKPSVSIKVLK